MLIEIIFANIYKKTQIKNKGYEEKSIELRIIGCYFIGVY
jgi:hypothetical protein